MLTAAYIAYALAQAALAVRAYRVYRDTPVVGFVVSKSGEVVMAASLVATGTFLARRASRAATPDRDA